MIKIRHAVKNDIPHIMKFIEENWNREHILAHNEVFFKYVYDTNPDEDKINFIIAEDDEDKKIYGIEGYILMNDDSHPDIAGTMWKAIPCDFFLLGIKMREYLIQSLNARMLCSPGINIKTNGIVSQYLGYHIDKLKHYYRLNDLSSYQIAKIKKKRISDTKPTTYSFVKIENFNQLESMISDELLRGKKPYKNLRYLNERYLMHPIFKYDIYGIKNDKSEVSSAIVIREIEYKGSRIGKVIDFIGKDEELAFISQSLENLIKEKQYEYIDFYCYGLAHHLLEQAGFTLRDEKDENIIPNYFEPFLQENVEIYFLCNNSPDVYVYRGDGDQDRPSKLAR